LQVTVSSALLKVINLTMSMWIFYEPIVTIMSIQLANVMKSCLITKRCSVLQAGAN